MLLFMCLLMGQITDAEFLPLMAEVKARGFLYDDGNMPAAFEARGVNIGRTRLNPIHKVNSEMGTFSANNDFPWAKPAGTDDSKNADRKFALLIKPHQKIIIRTDSEGYTRWKWPEGTIALEFAKVITLEGDRLNFQVNILHKREGKWRPNVFRPFRNHMELVARIKQLRPDWEKSLELKSLIDALEKHPRLRKDKLEDGHLKKQAFLQEGPIEILPAIDALLVRQLLTTTPFKSVQGHPWRNTTAGPIHGPTAKGFSIVPDQFLGGMIEVSEASCIRCHQDSGSFVREFDRFSTGGLTALLPSPELKDEVLLGRKKRRGNYAEPTDAFARHWYGVISGNDGLRSPHVFEPSSLSDSRLGVSVVLRREWQQQGLFKREE